MRQTTRLNCNGCMRVWDGESLQSAGNSRRFGFSRLDHRLFAPRSAWDSVAAAPPRDVVAQPNSRIRLTTNSASLAKMRLKCMLQQ